MPAAWIEVVTERYLFGGQWFHREELAAVRAIMAAIEQHPVLSRTEERYRAEARRRALEQLAEWPTLTERLRAVHPSSRANLETFVEHAVF